MKPLGLLLAFAPLLLFAVVGHLLGPTAVGWAALASTVLAVIILLAGLRRGVQLVAVACIIAFATLAALALLGGRGGEEFVATFGSGLVALLIGLVMLISVFTVPFTTPYARAAVPQHYWGSPTFNAVNKRISAVWAAVVCGVGISRLTYAIAATNEANLPAVLGLVLNWVVPIVLIIAGVRYTQAVAKHGTPQPQDAAP